MKSIQAIDREIMKLPQSEMYKSKIHVFVTITTNDNEIFETI